MKKTIVLLAAVIVSLLVAFLLLAPKPPGEGIENAAADPRPDVVEGAEITHPSETGEVAAEPPHSVADLAAPDNLQTEAKALEKIEIVNPSFELGEGGHPQGWTGRGNVLWGQGEGAGGSRFVSLSSKQVEADPKDSGGGEAGWVSAPIELVPGVAYELRIRARYRPETLFVASQLFVGPLCARQLITLEASEVASPWRTYSVRFVAPPSPQRIFLGAYQLQGTIEYDEIELFPIALAQASVDGSVLLGVGESITGNRYAYSAPFRNKEFRNVSRVLESANNVFHDDRWRFDSPNHEVIYRHELAGRKQVSADISVEPWFHAPTSWSLGVDVSTDGSTYRRLATLKEGDSGEVPLPADLLPAESVWVRLSTDTSDNSDPALFQVRRYEYFAEIDGPPLQADGQTVAVAVLGQDPAVQIQPLVSDPTAPAFDLLVKNRSEEAIVIKPELLIKSPSESLTRVPSPQQTLAGGKTARISIPYETPESGQYGLEFTLGQDFSTRLARSFYQNTLQLTNYGELLPSSSREVGLWWTSSGWKVSQTRPLPTAKSQAIRIRVAGNEAESAQFVLRPHKPLKSFTATVGALLNSSGEGLPAESVEILRVGYVNVDVASDEIGATGAWPDPLFPLEAEINVAADKNQPLMIRATIPAHTTPGIYSGKVRLAAEGFETTFPLEIEVYGFSLPDTTTCRALFKVGAGTIWQYQRLTTEADKRLVFDKYLEVFSNNRISPYDPTPLDPFTFHFAPEHVFWENARISTDMPFKGRKSLFVKDQESNENPHVKTVERLPISGKPLQLSFAYRTLKRDQDATVFLAFYNKAGTYLSGRNARVDLEGATEWATVKRTIEAIPRDAASVLVILQGSEWEAGGKTIGSAWFDELSLRDSGKELINDGGLEGGNNPVDKVEVTFDWTAWDAEMSRVMNKYHFNSFLFGGDGSFPGLGGGTISNRLKASFGGYAIGTPEHRALFREWSKAARTHLAEDGWLDKAVSYPFDEPNVDDYPFVLEQLSILKEDFPGLRRMVAMFLGAPDEFIGYVDYWCPLLSSFNPTFAQERQRAGDVSTWYICTAPRAPYVAMFIDRPATDMRVWLWQSWQNQVEGILIWTTNYWTSPAAYPDELQNPYLDTMSWTGLGGAKPGEKRPWAAGDGRLLYPPEASFDGGKGPVLDAPVSSIRLEAIRDGIEDYEYLNVLKTLLKARQGILSVEEIARCEKLLQVPESISTSLTSYTSDPTPILARRHEVAQAIEKLTAVSSTERE